MKNTALALQMVKHVITGFYGFKYWNKGSHIDQSHLPEAINKIIVKSHNY